MVRVDLYTSSFCAPCTAARATLAEAERIVPGLVVTERNVAQHPADAEADGIRGTPTTIIRNADGSPAFRAEGAPTLDQLLHALAAAS